MVTLQFHFNSGRNSSALTYICFLIKNLPPAMIYSSLIILYIADSFGNTISSINLITNLEVGTILQFKFYSRI